jgi:hypothetical protein
MREQLNPTCPIAVQAEPSPVLTIEHLHGREVRPHDGGDGVDDFRVERVFVTRLDELRADILQQLRVSQFRGKLRLPRFLLLLEIVMSRVKQRV